MIIVGAVLASIFYVKASDGWRMAPVLMQCGSNFILKAECVIEPVVDGSGCNSTPKSGTSLGDFEFLH